METGKLQLHTAFPTFIATYLWPEVEQFNVDLELALYRKRSSDPEGIYRSNAAGTWHSDLAVLKTCGEPGEKLGKMFYQLFSAMGDAHGGKKGGKYSMGLSAWAMMYQHGGYATAHTHPNCHFSGVYYVNTGDGQEPERTMATGVKIRPGSIEFTDTRGGPGALQVNGLQLAPALRIPPKAGLMVCFPAWLPHFVHPVEGEGERIAVACNATIQKYTLPPEKEDDDPDK